MKKRPIHMKRCHPLSFFGRISPSLLILFLVLISSGNLSAQMGGEDAVVLRQYQLPDTAVAMAQLVEIDGIAYLDGELFSGSAYQRYANLHLSFVRRYHEGHRHGYFYVWYPDGTPQLSTSYRRGRLNGRFVGWYPNGDVIYDIILNHGSFAGDYLFDDDENRQRTEIEITEGEGNIGDAKQD